MPTPKGTIPWNAGRGQGWTDKRGYRWLYVTEGGRKRARREHRVIMEKHLGRRLEPWELVHHKDKNTSNNALDNLEIKEWGAHTTQHHLGNRKSEDARRSMEAFALLRQELEHERAIKADLLEACKRGRQKLVTYTAIYSGDKELRTLLDLWDAAIAKAEGREVAHAS